MVTGTLSYWTVVDATWSPVPAADAYLRHLRLGADRAEGTTRSYAGDLALFLGWCEASDRDLLRGARDLYLFVGMLRTTVVERAGSGRGSLRSPGQGKLRGEVPIKVLFRAAPLRTTLAPFNTRGSPVTYAVYSRRTPSTTSAICISHTSWSC